MGAVKSSTQKELAMQVEEAEEIEQWLKVK